MLVSVNAVVIGSAGQDGRILVSELTRLGYSVIAVSRGAIHFDSLPIAFCDLSKENLASQFLSHFKPELIFHVAAVHGSSETQDSIIASNRADMYSCHVEITRNILTWLSSNSDTRFHLALSSQMYQPSMSSIPVNEETPTYPQNYYGQTKSEAWDLLQEYRTHNHSMVSASILFNHASKYSREGFVLTEIARQFVEIIKGDRSYVSLRNPFAMIDITSAIEICNAMILNVTRCPNDDFVLASGRSVRLSDIIVKAALDLGISDRISNLDYLAHPKVFDSPPIVLADPSKANRLLGWQAELKPEKILIEIISHKLKEK